MIILYLFQNNFLPEASQVALLVKKKKTKKKQQQNKTHASAEDVRDEGSIPGSRRSPGEGNGNLFRYSCLENPMAREAWWAIVHRVATSWV